MKIQSNSAKIWLLKDDLLGNSNIGCFPDLNLETWESYHFNPDFPDLSRLKEIVNNPAIKSVLVFPASGKPEATASTFNSLIMKSNGLP